MASGDAALRVALVNAEEGSSAVSQTEVTGRPKGLAVAAALTGFCMFGAAAVLALAPAKVPSGRASLYADVVNGSVSYLGCGCFWHVQHGLVKSIEEPLFDRFGAEITSFTGYAGGSTVGDGGRLCYHNAEDVADYSEHGQAEVASILLPEASALRVFDFFFDTICVGGDRRDTEDIHAQYRSIAGFPGGIGSGLGRVFVQSAHAHGVTVRAGEGNDPDARGTVVVMDTAVFPFHQAEVYHQFHDDMVDIYGTPYNRLQQQLTSSGELRHTGCPGDER